MPTCRSRLDAAPDPTVGAPRRGLSAHLPTDRGSNVLHPYRVLDLTGRRGWFTGFLLAQLGADVALVEPPGGWPRDLHHEAYNRGKRSIVLDGAGEVAALAAGADVVLDDGAWTDLDLAALRAANPGLITVTTTPYGGSGPKAAWLATDLTLFAASGQMAVTGDRDRPPVRTSVPQAWLHGAADAAVGALVALAARERCGLGQHVDVSVQQSVTLTSLPAVLFAAVGLVAAPRESGGVRLGDTRLRWVYPARDGHVAISLAFGPMIGPFQRRLMTWAWEEGCCDEATRDKDWVGYGELLARGAEPMSELERVMDCVEALTSSKTKAELMVGALERRLLIAPVSTLADVQSSPQLAARDYWDDVDGVRHPGPIVRASATPLPRLGAAPATPGGDAAEVRSRFRPESAPPPAAHPAAPAAPPGAPAARPAAPAARPPAPDDRGAAPDDRGAAADDRGAADRPLAGLKVLDLAWVAAAPLATRVLAYWGATVVRVESSTRPDLTRVALGHRDDITEVENAITHQLANAGKLGLALNLGVPEARDVALDLARWADVAIESFTPGTVAAWGLAYDDLRAVNPGIVMLSSCVMGQSGPWAGFAGFGNLSASIAGFFDLTGWPDRTPAGPYMAYTDYTSPRFTLIALLAALDHRRRTGEGQYLDFSQMEAATHLLTPALLELQHEGRMWSRDGNADPDAAPHAVYPAAGDDGWVAVVCENDAHWRALATEMRRPDLADLTTADRLARRGELDELIAGWTRRQDPIGLQYRLQAQGVPAHAVQHSGECLADAQLAHRGHFGWLPHPYVRWSIVDNQPQQLSRSRGGYGWAGPIYGQHTEEILRDLLGYDDDRIAELAAAEALE